VTSLEKNSLISPTQEVFLPLNSFASATPDLREDVSAMIASAASVQTIFEQLEVGKSYATSVFQKGARILIAIAVQSPFKRSNENEYQVKN